MFIKPDDDIRGGYVTGVQTCALPISIVGGNVTSIISALGTPYKLDTRGKILFLEETSEPVNTVYRYLEMLELSGKFSDCIGIVMGECTNCPPAYNTSYEDLINAFIVPLGKPLMTNVTTVHGRLIVAIR